MTFNQIVLKMAKYHYKKYLFYLTCNSLAVMFIFMFMTVYLNEQLVSVKYAEGIQYLLAIPGAALILFTVFFISYTHHVFMKKRRSEFGLFMTLGMTNRDIGRLLLLENSTIALTALFIGLGMGAVISKFFFRLLLKSVGIQEITFQVNVKMFIYAIITFMLVFIVTIGQSLYITMKRNVIESLKTEKVTENIAYKHPAIGGIGVVFIIGSIIGLYTTYTNPNSGDYLLLWAMGTFLGLYIALNQLTSFLIGLIKKNKHFYYRKLLYLTSFDYKYKQFTTIMTIVTVMIMVTLLYSTIILNGYLEMGKEAVQRNPYDVGFISTDTKNNLSADEVYSIFEKHKNPVQEHFPIPIYLNFEKSYDGYIRMVTFMPLSAFKEITDYSLEVQTNELIFHLNDMYEGDLEGISYGHKLRYSINGSDVIYHYNQMIGERHFNYLGSFFIINDSDLAALMENTDGLDAVIHLINLENWEESEDAVLELEQAFISYNSETPTLDIKDIPPEEELFYVTSRVDGYANRMNTDGIQLFVAIFLSILFFIGSFFLLYIQLFSEVDKEKQRISKLYRIGITKKEVKKLVSQEITTIFMLPTLLGIIIALFYLIAMAKDIGGILVNPEILFQFFLIAGIYLVIQLAFLIYTRRKMFDAIYS